MKYIITSSFFAFAIALSGSIVRAVVIEGLPADATVQEYVEKYRSVDAALERALREGNHAIIADLLELDPTLNAGFIKMALRMQQLEDLHDLFNAMLSKKELTLQELIQVLRIFKAEPRKINQYGDCETPKRVCHGNDALDFSKLDQNLAIKVAAILGVKSAQ